MKKLSYVISVLTVLGCVASGSLFAQTSAVYSTFGDTDSVISKEQPLMPAAPATSVQSSAVISQTASATQFPTTVVIDPAAAASARFWSAGRIAALSAVALAAVSVLANSSATTQH
jgi:hypothetical protein